jgi:hypothetical protein
LGRLFVADPDRGRNADQALRLTNDTGVRGAALRTRCCGKSAPPPASNGGLDWTGKIIKDMRMTAMPRIGARWSCVDWGVPEQ